MYAPLLQYNDCNPDNPRHSKYGVPPDQQLAKPHDKYQVRHLYEPNSGSWMGRLRFLLIPPGISPVPWTFLPAVAAITS